MAEVLWYYEEAGRQAGPVTASALEEAIRAGGLAPGARVWTAGMAGWLAWEAVPRLAALAAPPAPPPLGAPPPGWGAPPGAGSAPPFSGNSHAADVLTGAGVPRLYPKAPLGARFLAAVLDNLVSSVPAVLLGLATAGAFGAGSSVLGALLAVLAAAAIAWAVWYSFTKDGRPGGASIGKKAMGLMVVHLPSNQPCTAGQSALRYLILFATNLVPYVGWLVEPVVLLAAAGGRRIGDQAAGTQVIRAADFAPHAPGRPA
jgi:uncharacterized RDD family membrane protein YckC